jgi:hypothetical protein
MAQGGLQVRDMIFQRLFGHSNPRMMELLHPMRDGLPAGRHTFGWKAEGGRNCPN